MLHEQVGLFSSPALGNIPYARDPLEPVGLFTPTRVELTSRLGSTAWDTNGAEVQDD
jgi:hypothetical protein